jgi:hypothetical protein
VITERIGSRQLARIFYPRFSARSPETKEGHPQ